MTVDQYLRTSHRPDCVVFDGALVERTGGLKDHSRLVGRVSFWFFERRETLGVASFISQRIRTSANRFRIPDVCVVRLPEPDEQIFTKPPYICIEILSAEDTLAQLQARFDDYLALGVSNIWVVDPASRRGWQIIEQCHVESLDGILRTDDGRVELPLADLFAE